MWVGSKTYLDTGSVGQASLELHQGARDLVAHGSMALVVVHGGSGGRVVVTASTDASAAVVAGGPRGGGSGGG